MKLRKKSDILHPSHTFFSYFKTSCLEIPVRKLVIRFLCCNFAESLYIESRKRKNNGQ